MTITYTQTEALLKAVPIIRARLASLQIELQTVTVSQSLETPENIIEMLVLGRHINGMPALPPGTISDKTAAVAEIFRQVLNAQRYGAIKEVAAEMVLLWSVIERIDIALGALTELQRQIIRLYYFHRRTWDEIAGEINRSKRKCQEARRDGVETVMKVIQVEEELFGQVMERLGNTKEGPY